MARLGRRLRRRRLGGGGGTTTSSTSSKVTSTVNETVNQVDETVTGGALEATGVTQVTEEVVNGVVGPESTVGKTVDETVKTVKASSAASAANTRSA